ncbi:uncharacterized protein LOC111065878 [Drosophila obscura]|uniref:uncharacterized protein LOC111065878 n=1 Tax=Drosophila obscura TaxID=7282 RepID=UPI001BB20336|nr:uncharacterized protein LOC111065878 [Drosophila obscura]
MKIYFFDQKMRCAVINCQYATMAPTKKEQICFFKFPRNADLAKRWLSFSGNKDALKVKNASICMKHFKDEDILGSRKFEMGLAKKRTARPGAVPCINPGTDSASERARKEETHIRKRLLAELLADAEETDMSQEDTEPTPSYDRYRTDPASVSPSHIEENAYLQTISHEDCPEADADDAEETQESLMQQLNKCRTCYRDFEFDLNAEDPFDNANSVLLFRIEVICGVWLSNIEGGPRFMCPDCQLSLKNAIEFREMVISTEVLLTQGMPVCDKPEIEIELESTEQDQRTTEWTTDSVSTKMDEDVDDDEETRYEDTYDASPSPVHSTNSNQMEIIEPIEEDINVARANNSISRGRGAKNLNELLSERTRFVTKADTPAKIQPKPRKMKIQEILQDDDEEDETNSKVVPLSAFERKNRSMAKTS